MKTDSMNYSPLASGPLEHGTQANATSYSHVQAHGATVNPTQRFGRRQRLKRSELLTITTQLSIMSKAGMDLADAVQKIALRSKSPRIAESLSQVHEDLQNGKSFSAALKGQSQIYGEGFVASIVAGEASGQITEVLSRLKDLIRNDVRIRSTIRGALVYPIVLFSIAMIVLAALIFFVLPQFDKVFTNMGATVPLLTRILLDFGRIARSYIILELILAGAFAVFLYKFWSFRPFMRWRHRSMLEMRFLRDGYRPLTTGRVFRLIGTMLESGVPLMETVRISRQTVRNSHFDELFTRIEEAILAGGNIAPVLAESQCVPDGAAEMVATAEQTGDLGGVLRMVGEYFEEEGERTLRDQVKLIEPAIIVGMGLLVSVVVSSVMLPLFDLSSAT